MEKNNKTPLKDRMIPWYFVMAFIVIFAVNGLFIYFAMHTHNGVVTENAYEKGLNYEHIVEQVRKQKQEQSTDHGTSD